MRCRILHESKGRMRVQLIQYRMTFEEADILDNYLSKLAGVSSVKVHERTKVAIIEFSENVRNDIIDALSGFDYESNRDLLMTTVDRQLQYEFENKLCLHVGRRVFSKLFIPAPLMAAVTVIKAIPFIVRGLKALIRGKLEVSVLDATSITVSMLRGDFSTAGSIMFMLRVG